MRCHAAWSLAALGATASPAVPDLSRLLGDEASAVRCAAAESIWMITGNSTDNVRIGLDLLDDTEWLERVVAAETLGGLGKAAEPAVPRFRQAVTDDLDAAREAVSAALHEIETRG